MFYIVKYVPVCGCLLLSYVREYLLHTSAVNGIGDATLMVTPEEIHDRQHTMLYFYCGEIHLVLLLSKEVTWNFNMLQSCRYNLHVFMVIGWE